MKTYYEDNKHKLFEMAKENSRNTQGRRLVSQLNNNVTDISTVQDQPIEKWNIKFNTVEKEYYINDKF